MNPAATLSILVKAQGVQTTAGQLKGLDAAGRNAGKGMAVAETSAKRSSKTFSVMGTAAKSAGLLVGAAGLAAGAKVMVREFREAQKVGGQTTAVLKSTGNAAKVTVKHIQDLAGAISKKAGIDDEAIQSGENLLLTFTKIRNEAGAGNKIFDRTTQVITDMSVALGQPMKSSAIQVGKALQDPIKGITALRRVGVNFNKQQSDQIAKMVESGHQLEAQRTILKELTKEFGGSAAAQATAGDKFKVSLNNLAEAAGAVLVPALDKVERFLTTLMDQMVRGVGVGGALVSTFRTTGNVIGSVAGTIAGLVKGFQDGNTGAVLLGIAVGALTAGFLAYKTLVIATAIATKAMAAAQVLLNIAMYANPIGLVVIGLAALAAALAIAYVKFETFRTVVDGTFKWIKSNWPLVLGILTGPIGLAVVAIAKNWSAIKSAFSSGVAAILGILRGSVSAIAGAGTAMGKALINSFKSALNFAHELAVAMRDLIAKAPGFALGVGKAIVSGIISGIKSAASGIGNAIKGAVGSAAGAINPFGEGIGKKLGIVPMKAPGSLMGARPSLAPFAAVGAANGLRVSSGLRRGAITSSGNTSYHSTGEAVDLAGPPAGMLKTFRTLRSRFGSKLAELIHTPGGAGIKDGKPFVYTGKVAADHFDHVHVAFDSGAPGPGDGIGRARSAAAVALGDGPGKLGGQALANLWVKAGGDPKLAGLMARIALAESGGDPSAHNPSGATGLWQILGAMVKGNLTNPLVNARNAVAKYKAQGLGAWAASKASWGKYVGHPGISVKGATKGAAKASQKINPFDQKIASADVAIADAHKAVAQAAATNAKRKIIGSRIRAIRKALKGKLTPATRLRLTQELGTRLGEHAQLGKDVQELRHPTVTDTSLGADVSPSGPEGDPNQPLIDAIAASVAAERDHTAALTALRDEVAKQNAIAGSTIGIGLREAQKALADMIANQLGSYAGTAGRALTAGSGTVVRY